MDSINDDPAGYAGPGTLMAVLHLPGPVALDRDRVVAEVRDRLPGSGRVEADDDGPLLVAHHAFTTDFADAGGVPIQTAVLNGRAGPTDHDKVDLSQTWGLPDAAERLTACRHELVVSELMGRPRLPVERVAAFRAVLLAVVRQTSPSAIWWPTAGLLTDAPDEEGALLRGLVNVRMFRTEGTGGDLLMDTLGLAALGLPDVQCHYRGLDARQVAGRLHDVANYLFEAGDVIEDGHPVEGLDPSQYWRCQHEEAICGPRRVVLDVDPGPPFAAGGRSTGRAPRRMLDRLLGRRGRRPAE